MRFNLDYMPKTARDLIEIIGLPATLRLVKRRGGQTLRPAKGRNCAGAAAFSELSEDIGETAANKLASVVRDEISIPRCIAALREAERDAIRHDFDELTIGPDACSGRRAAKTLAGRYKCTERWIYKVLSMAYVSGGEIVDSDSQMPLF